MGTTAAATITKKTAKTIKYVYCAERKSAGDKFQRDC